jgi:hypothetical protein
VRCGPNQSGSSKMRGRAAAAVPSVWDRRAPVWLDPAEGDKGDAAYQVWDKGCSRGLAGRAATPW